MQQDKVEIFHPRHKGTPNILPVITVISSCSLSSCFLILLTFPISLKKIPISINNSLLSISLHISTLENDKNYMYMCGDINDVMNAGNWYSEMTAKYLQCG